MEQNESSLDEKASRKSQLQRILTQIEQTPDQERVKLYKDVVNFDDSQVKQVC